MVYFGNKIKKIGYKRVGGDIYHLAKNETEPDEKKRAERIFDHNLQHIL